MGLWRVVLPNRQDLYESKWVPRMALLGAGTVARNFAFVSKPRVQKLAESVYAVSFEAPGDIVMGVWTVNGGCKVKVELKAPMLFSDAWGNEKKLPTGRQAFDVSTTPFILRFPKSARLVQEDAIADFTVVSRDENPVDVTIPVPQGEPAKAQVSFSAPEAVFPARAATPEAGIFARDCHVWPQVETAFGWTEDAFCAMVTVKNKALIQRQRDAAAVRDDCVIFTFLDDNPAEGGHELMKVANEIVAYAGEQGGRAFLRNPDGGRFVSPCGTCKIVKKGQMETTYDVRIPWKDVMPDFKPARNARFAFNMRCPCVPHLGVNDSAPYSLMLSKPLAEDRLNMSQWVFLEFCRHVELK